MPPTPPPPPPPLPPPPLNLQTHTPFPHSPIHLLETFGVFPRLCSQLWVSQEDSVLLNSLVDLWGQEFTRYDHRYTPISAQELGLYTMYKMAGFLNFS